MFDYDYAWHYLDIYVQGEPGNEDWVTLIVVHAKPRVW